MTQLGGSGSGSSQVAGWMLAAVTSSEVLTKAEDSLLRCCAT